MAGGLICVWKCLEYDASKIHPAVGDSRSSLGKKLRTSKQREVQPPLSIHPPFVFFAVFTESQQVEATQKIIIKLESRRAFELFCLFSLCRLRLPHTIHSTSQLYNFTASLLSKMVLDYSKWDALELSDDSDVEVHPNVDKRSFIRAKQNQIHQQRLQRRHDIETRKYERVINDGLLARIDRLLAALKEHGNSSRTPEELVFQALIESAGDPADDQPPPPPEGIYTHEKEQPKYSQMMGSLVDQVKKELEESKPDDRYKGFVQGIEGHRGKVLGLQQQLLQNLAELEKEDKAKITSENYHTGFDSSFVAKSDAEPKDTTTKSTTSAELLNPGSVANEDVNAVSSGAEADEEDGPGDDEAEIKPTALAKEFAKIKIGDYNACMQFITKHREILTERKTDELLMEAFDAQLAGKEGYARQCVHQGLLLQYCRSLGYDGVGLFFKR